MDHIEKLRQIINASGMTQDVLARRLGVSFPTLNAWINGRSQPRRSALERIDIAYAEFVGGTTLEPTALQDLISQAEAQHFTLRQLTQDKVARDRLTLLLTYHTDAIEGSTMTLADTDAVLFHDTALPNRTFVEQLEAKNHQTALWWLIDQLRSKTFAITEEVILEIHGRLMNGILSDAGQYRRHAVRISDSRVTVANYLRIPTLVHKLCNEDFDEGKSLIAYMANQHARFENIHPFSDGNGRVGRLLMVAIALQHNIVPPIIERERRTFYYKALEAAQLEQEFELLQQLIAESAITAQANIFDS